MKLRIGIGMGTWPFPERRASAFHDFIARCEDIGVDSLWFSDRVVGPQGVLEPVVAMAALAAVSKRMKFGVSAITLALRHPVVLAKELATLDFLSNGRTLLVAGLGQEDPAEYDAVGVSKAQRAGRTEEAIQAMRLLWSQERASFQGRYYRFQDVAIAPRPVQQPGPPIWIGGRSDAALRRTGRLGDGWLPSAVTAGEAGAGVEAIRRYAAEAGREVPEDHYGVYLTCAISDTRQEAERLLPQAAGARRQDVPPSAYTAVGTAEDIIARVNQYGAVGVTKFVLRPACPPELWVSQVERLAREVIAPVQTPFTPEELRERAGVA
ncbi:MAG: LLM class flavin-dependent oxidoreductase [Chloroflexi bacterium]|nr:LLM class flavin-dependent oxidoreductase [Chloroflexota bacterium]